MKGNALRVFSWTVAMAVILAMGMGLTAVVAVPVAAGFTPTPTPAPPTPTMTPRPATPSPPPPPPTATPLPSETPPPTLTPTPWCYTVTPGPPPTETPAYAVHIVVDVQMTPAVADPGDHVRMTVTIRNEGNAPATHLVMRTTLADALLPFSVQTPRGIPAVNGQDISVALGTLDGGEEVVITIESVVRSGVAPGQGMHAAVSVTYDGGEAGGTFPPPPPTPVPPTLDRPICPFLPESGGHSAPSSLWSDLLFASATVLFIVGAALWRRTRRS